MSGKESPSRSSTPNPRFTVQNTDAEDLLKEHTVGLVELSEFRKRRAEALEATSNVGTPDASGASTPLTGDSTAILAKKKKRGRGVKKGGLSFGDEDVEDEYASVGVTPAISRTATPGLAPDSAEGVFTPAMPTLTDDSSGMRKKLKPSSSISIAPKVMTRVNLLKEAQLKEQLRKDFILMQEAVKSTEIAIPFVFYDGSNTPGGVCRVKKGDHIWLFLERARKVGADLAAGGDKSRKDWARIGVDDLILVRGDLIIPHHYEFYHFILNRTLGYRGPLFPYSAQTTSTTPKTGAETTDSSAATPSAGLIVPDPHQASSSKRKQPNPASPFADSELEGYEDDPTTTKVVDRRWYERNKHIYPASTWEDFDPERDYTTGGRKDGEGNAFFFSR